MADFRLGDHYTPIPETQKKLHDSLARFKAFIGGFGSGKTLWLIWEIIMECLDKPNNLGVASRATYGELEDTLQKDFMDECPPEIIRKWEKTVRRLTFINGSVLLFRAFDKVRKIKSMNLGFFAFDQGEEVDEKFFLGLIGRIRRAGFKTKAFLAANYVPRSWLIKLFTKDKKDHHWFDFCVANAHQNKYLDPEYIETMRELYPESWVNRYVDLNLKDIEKADDGRRFKFTDKHYADRETFPYIFDKEVNPEHCKFMLGIDAGVGSPTSVIFVAVDIKDYNQRPDGLAHVYFYDEIYEVDKSVEQIAYLIKSRMRKWGFRLADGTENPKKKMWQTLIDPNTNRKQQGKRFVENVFKMYHEFDIPVVPSINDRAYGIMRMMGLIEKNQITVANECENFKEEGESYMKDPNKDHVDDLGQNEYIKDDMPPKKQRDHALDGGRYAIVKIPIFWFSLLLKHKDINTLKALMNRKNGTRPGKKRGATALQMAGSSPNKDRHFGGLRVG